MLKRRFSLVFVATLVGAASLPGQVRAEQYEPSAQMVDFKNVSSRNVSSLDRIGALESELAALRQQLDKGMVQGRMVGFESGCDALCEGGCTGACGGVCEGTDACCGTGGIVAGAEATVMVAHNGSLRLDIPAANVSGFAITPDYDAEISPRLWLGYQGPNRLGVRARYWQYDHGASGTSLPPVIGIDLISGLEAQALDGEFMQTAVICDWEVEYAGGVRWGKIEEGLSVDAGGIAATLFRDFEGFGPTAGVSVRRPIFSGGLSLVGGFRASLLYGDDAATIRENVLGLFDGISLEAKDNVLEIFEIQVGAEWHRPMNNGASLFARAVFEGQAWEMSPILLGTGDSTIGFLGGSFGFGIDR